MTLPFVGHPVRVSVPATSANLGPGFDSLGLALGLRDRLTASVADSGLTVTVEGEGAGGVPRDESHLVVRALRAGLDALGGQPPGLMLTCDNVVPHARGLGSSSAAIVGGLGLARALVEDGDARLPDDDLLQLAAGLEGHPDNVAPALYGGFTVAGREGDRFFAARGTVDLALGALVFVPADGVRTEVARGLLPAVVPHADAAADAGRAALLVLALRDGDPGLLLAATRDWLHQDYREAAMPATLALVRALRTDGIPAAVSGAGPAVLALCGEDDPAIRDRAAARCPQGWRLLTLSVDRDGLRVG